MFPPYDILFLYLPLVNDDPPPPPSVSFQRETHTHRLHFSKSVSIQGKPPCVSSLLTTPGLAGTHQFVILFVYSSGVHPVFSNNMLWLCRHESVLLLLQWRNKISREWKIAPWPRETYEDIQGLESGDRTPILAKAWTDYLLRCLNPESGWVGVVEGPSADSKAEPAEIWRKHTGMGCYVVSFQEKPESMQSPGEGWGWRIQSPVPEEKLFNSLKPNLTWNKKMCCVFTVKFTYANVLQIEEMPRSKSVCFHM